MLTLDRNPPLGTRCILVPERLMPIVNLRLQVRFRFVSFQTALVILNDTLPGWSKMAITVADRTPMVTK